MPNTAAKTNPRSTRVAPRRAATRKTGPLLMALGLVFAVATVLFIPAVVGGAQTTSVSASVSTLQPATATSYTTLSEAVGELGFTPHLPVVGGEESIAAITVLDGNVLEISYVLGSNTLVYRTATGNDDLTGDATEYAYTAYETVDGIARSYAGPTENNLNIAFWAADGYSYALVVNGMEADTLRSVAQSIQ